MHTFVSILATIALLASTGAACLNAGVSKGFTLRMPSGPDAMGVVVFFIFSIFGWLLTLVGAVLVASVGALGFVAAPAGAAVIAAVAAGALGFLSVLAMAASLDRKLPGHTAIGWAGALALPVVANAYLGVLAWMVPESAAASLAVRLVGAGLGVIALAGGVGAVVVVFKSQAAAARRVARASQERERSIEQNRVEAAERDVRHEAELAALPDGAPLATFVTHLFIDKSEAHHARALARIAKLPDLAARFDRELMDPDPLAREYLLNYFRVAPANAPALAAAMTPVVARCFEHLAEDLHWLKDAVEHRAYGHARGMTLGLLLTASRFPVRFTQPARALRVALDRWPNEDVRRDAQELVDRYLAGQSLQ